MTRRPITSLDISRAAAANQVEAWRIEQVVAVKEQHGWTVDECACRARNLRDQAQRRAGHGTGYTRPKSKWSDES